jgi:ATP-dependent RNA helicase SUPV3L1/SUV3
MLRVMAAPSGMARAGAGVTAVLGPTNTGKTHLAVERMLGHRNGMIGLPLRLLAREVYDRAVQLKGPSAVALITGEERILPRHPSYIVATVEAMPLDRRVDFLAVDEIQLASDSERGHVFTDRLLRARGEKETLFLGADSMRRAIQQLLPEAEFVSRPRFSVLSYRGEKKLSRLPRRSAIVAFSAADVYTLAELVRRQRGGAAVVLGALSPRTRNAQVALYQAGEVDYLVATDAIGMGLNMNVDHVAFAGLRKFDGSHVRRLEAAEIGQIAGRAGRHMNDGSFGTSAGIGPIDADTVQLVEQHRFPPVRHLQWRNSRLNYRSIKALISSLEVLPEDSILVRARPADDLLALQALARDPDCAALANGPAAISRLWEVCQIPDFRKSLAEHHQRLLRQIYRHLMAPEGVLPADWVATQVARLDRIDGDIDTLATRIAHTRTWTYISHRSEWLADAGHWQERAREIEDKLSDALHVALTSRFVDRRTAVLLRRLKDRESLFAAVTADGEVLVEGQYVGRLKGLSFAADAADPGTDGRAIRSAANRVLARELANRAARLAGAAEAEIAWKEDNRFWWDGAPVARLARGPEVWRPAVAVPSVEHLSGPLRERVRRRLSDWLEVEIGGLLRPLEALRQAELEGPARGIAYQLLQGLGSLPRAGLGPLIDGLAKADRERLKRLGVRLGFLDVFLPALLKPAHIRVRARLWAAAQGLEAPPAPPLGLVSARAEPDWPEGFAGACGYRVIGRRAYRVDMLDRLASQVRGAARAGAFEADHAMLSLIGCGREEIAEVLSCLGYRASHRDGATSFRFTGRLGEQSSRSRGNDAHRRAPAGSPFAALGRIKAGG